MAPQAVYYPMAIFWKLFLDAKFLQGSFLNITNIKWKEVIKKNWDYCLYGKEGKLIFIPLSGKYCFINVKFELKQVWRNIHYNEIGQTFLSRLVDMVREKTIQCWIKAYGIQIELDNLLPKQLKYINETLLSISKIWFYVLF